MSRTIPVANELLKTISNGFDITIFISLNIFDGILKGPVAFDTFNFDISCSISAAEVGGKKIYFEVDSHVLGALSNFKASPSTEICS